LRDNVPLIIDIEVSIRKCVRKAVDLRPLNAGYSGMAELRNIFLYLSVHARMTHALTVG
jgi:hypothetical protein